jgi:hypothetical protein
MGDILTNLDDEECCGQGCSRCLTTEPLGGEFVSGRLDGIKLHLCTPLDCQCGHCEAD